MATVTDTTALRAYLADTVPITAVVWSRIASSGAEVDRVVSRSVKEEGIGSRKAAALQEATLKMIARGSKEVSTLGKVACGVSHRATRRCLKKCLAICAYLFGEGVVNSRSMDAYIALHGHLGKLTPDSKLKYACQLSWMPVDISKSIVEKIEAMRFAGRSKHKIWMQQALFGIMGQSKEVPPAVIAQWVDMVSDIFACEVSFEFSKKPKAMYQLLTRLLQCVQANKIVFRIVTCPDYNGHLVRGVWHFDCSTIGDGVGLVGQRAVPFVEAVARIADKYMVDVTIEHFLPTYEGAKEDARYGPTNEKLQRSLAAVGALYTRPVSLALTKERFSDESFRAKTVQVVKEDGVDAELLYEVLRKRKALYNGLYATCSAEERIARVQEQVAQYVVIGKWLSEEPHSLLLASDSMVICETYAHKNVPFLFGMAKGAVRYLGDR